MIKKNKVTTKYVTEKYLDKRLEEQDKRFDKRLDLRFEEQDKRLKKTMDQRFDEQDKRFDKRMDTRLEEYTKIILDAFDSRFDKVDTRIDDLKSNINAMQVTLDKTTKSQATTNQEFIIVKAEVGQMKRVFKQKLGVEIRAV